MNRLAPSEYRARRIRLRLLEADGVLDIPALLDGCKEIARLIPPPECAPPVITPREPPKPVRIQISSRTDGDGHVYVVKCGDLYKIGSSRTNHRLRSLQTGNPEVIEPVLTIQTRQHAHSALENRLHEMFKSQRVRGEWFSLSSADIDRIRAIRDGGLM